MSAYSRNPSRFSLIASVLALGFACAGAKPPSAFRGPAPENASDRAMAKLAERYLDSALKLQPVQASYVGYHKWDGLLPDFSDAGVNKAIRTLTYFRHELAKIRRSKLSLSWSIDHELITSRIDARLYELQTLKPHTWDVKMYNEAIGGAFYYITIPPADAADWPQRLEAVLARMEALPSFLKTAQTQLKSPPALFTQYVMTANAGNVATFEKTLPPLFKPYPQLQKRFDVLAPKAIAAVQAYGKFLQAKLLPRSKGDWRLGTKAWNGKLRHTLEADVDAKQLYLDAERGLSIARFEMYDLALPIYRKNWPEDLSYQALLGDARINHVVGRVINEASKKHGTAESFFEDVRKHSKNIKSFIRTSGLVALPPETDNFVIEPTPSFLDGLAVAFYNPAPAFEPDLKKSYWISSVPASGSEDGESYLREYNDYILQALTIHEAFPGHYVQLYWSSHSKNASITKQVLESGTMAEGWAVMIEQLMHEEGYSKGDPTNQIFHLKMRLRVYINAMIDAKLHTSKAPEAETDAWALEMMMTQGFQEKAEATRKLRRAKLSSTQLSTYFVGYREMLGIYRDAVKKGKASKQEILKKMLSYGTIPPKTIRKMMKSESLL